MKINKIGKIFVFLMMLVLMAGILWFSLEFLKNLNLKKQKSLSATIFQERSGSLASIQLENNEEKLNYFVTKEVSVSEKQATGLLKEKIKLTLPEEFKISVYEKDLKEPRFFTFNKENDLIVAQKGAAEVTMLRDENDDGISDRKIEIDRGLKNVNGIYFFEESLYVAVEDKILRYNNLKSDGSYKNKEVLIDLTNKGKGLKNVVIGLDRRLYVLIGSSCNECSDEETGRATILRYDLNGEGEEIFAQGLRNSLDLVFRRSSHGNHYVIWGPDNSSDMTGEDFPHDEINRILKSEHYGWPYCYDNGKVNSNYFEKRSFCKNESRDPDYLLEAQSKPLGMSFVPWSQIDTKFPSNMADDLFVALNGSVNKSQPSGYKIVRIDTNDKDSKPKDFITGWLMEDGKSWGRPVDIGFDQEGVIFVSDDKAGLIYRVTRK